MTSKTGRRAAMSDRAPAKSIFIPVPPVPRWDGSPADGQAATLQSLDVAVAVEAQPTVHDLAGQVQDGGVIVQDAGVGGQDDPTAA
jgi:hypothetical protein